MKQRRWMILGAAVTLALFTVPGSAVAQGGPGLHSTPLVAGQTIDAGEVRLWNSPEKMMIRVDATGQWRIAELQVYVGTDSVPTTRGNPVPGRFPFKRELEQPVPQATTVIDLGDDLGFAWGTPYERVHNVAVHADLVLLDGEGTVIGEEGAWAHGPFAFEGSQWGWWLTYELAHPRRGHFIDSPVQGVTYATQTFEGLTGDGGDFLYFPGEQVALGVGPVYLGLADADHRMTPLDLFPGAELSDPRVVNMARFLQSLDADGDSGGGIAITEDVVGCLESALTTLGLQDLDFGLASQVDAAISETVEVCSGVEGVSLRVVSAEEALEHLEKVANAVMFRRNVSKTPLAASGKGRIDIASVWVPAQKADGTPVVIEYYDDEGNLVRSTEWAKPLVVSYLDAAGPDGAQDVFLAISRDDGATWKRKNVSRMADRSSFTLADGTPFYGDCHKEGLIVKGNKVFLVWTSKFARGGRPAYAIDLEDDYPYDDPYYTEDIWGVGGPQRSIDYTDLGFPEVGEIPFSAVWAVRAQIDPLTGDITYFKPERLTSGRRDANQVFRAAASGAGFAVAWQEDPAGLRPGDGAGPGEGWSGATTNHKTDIWYSFIRWEDFGEIDQNFVPGGDPEHDDPELAGRAKALVPMSLPVRISDNDAVNTDNLMVELDGSGDPVTGADGSWTPIVDEEGRPMGTHAYAYELPGLCTDLFEFVNQQGETKRVCVTEDLRLLDGNTGASRPNLMLQPYKRQDGTMSAWAILGYEESKGVGGGPPDWDPDTGPHGDEWVPDEGKNFIYHSFDFTMPELVSAGGIVNHPELDEVGNPVYLQDEVGTQILDWKGDPMLAYENARRPRFLLQPKSKIGDSRTVLVTVYKQGEEGHGRPSDILMRRIVATATGNPYAFASFVCDRAVTVADGSTVCVEGARNLSTVTPTEIWINPDSETDNESIKVVRWVQTEANLLDSTSANPYEDARAHRGAIRGDKLVVGFTHTPNWKAWRNGNDKYDFYVRRSFDGGQTWTTDPYGSGVTHCQTFTDPVTKIKEEVCTTYGAGQFEAMRDLSQLPNNKESVIEPRIVSTPGTIKDPATGMWTGEPEDLQDPNVFYASYGTSANQDVEAPLDLFYSATRDFGETYGFVEWQVNPDSDGNYAGEVVLRWPWLAKGDPEQGEAQLRMTPDGSRMYSVWNQNGEEGSDIWFRRVPFPETVE